MISGNTNNNNNNNSNRNTFTDVDDDEELSSLRTVSSTNSSLNTSSSNTSGGSLKSENYSHRHNSLKINTNQQQQQSGFARTSSSPGLSQLGKIKSEQERGLSPHRSNSFSGGGEQRITFDRRGNIQNDHIDIESKDGSKFRYKIHRNSLTDKLSGLNQLLQNYNNNGNSGINSDSNSPTTLTSGEVLSPTTITGRRLSTSTNMNSSSLSNYTTNNNTNNGASLLTQSIKNSSSNNEQSYNSNQSTENDELDSPNLSEHGSLSSSPSVSVNELQERISVLTAALLTANQKLEDFQNSMEKSMSKQSELKNYYQNFVKNLTKQHNQKLEDYQLRIKELENEKKQLRKEVAESTNDVSIIESIVIEKPEAKEFSQVFVQTDACQVVNSNLDLLSFSKNALEVCRSTKSDLELMKTHVMNLIPSDMLQKLSTIIIRKTAEKLDIPTVTNFFQKKIQFQEDRFAQLNTLYVHEQQVRKLLQNQLIEERGNLRVCCRIRPMWVLESEKNMAHNSYRVKSCISQEKTTDSVVAISRMGRNRSFELDQVYGMESTQDGIFSDIRPLVSSAFDGFNTCLMVFGETGSGKTFTMNGSLVEPGIVPRSITELYRIMEVNQCYYNANLRLSIAEVYNNELRDLINPEKEYKSSNDLNYVKVESEEQLRQIIKDCIVKRTESKTLMNSNSSRSHCIISVEIEKRVIPKKKENASQLFEELLGMKTNNQQDFFDELLSPQQVNTKSVLRFVDLAGSENVEMSGVAGDQLTETSFVNKSLSALEDVIVALASKQKHVPFRNSRLTHVLKDSLSGDSKILIIVTVSPQERFGAETVHALSFAERVKSIKKKKATRQTIM
ncbi:kinesin-14 [Naegleria gruberi]|uniref:Kinesin-like protein n=1 Tax=Naegleria gruberi TaxID=5762 RepID=D2W1K8_NAEGR|nr:kinesin-14 [Naegleria gruberi]EFC37109.1 kinesin-14 [Naegleria gruberi]|eukprot:XP_002669853.1 kinesin-14 [Naegleria gruberi]